ncbi:hypothetical protein [Algibacter sp. 2305UL17-15]|uniref:hypothetical protein n=1 Tax=Algibacter sp. 2305UL17-15 TaxID=3231268 RepID=UPI0034586DEA
MKHLVTLLISVLCFINCNNPKKDIAQNITKETGITCSNNGCEGTYQGAEFINGSDIAHQFSNKMSHAVGNKLKESYHSKQYRKVDFPKIKMTTEGMGSGKVIYKLTIPFIAVEEKCDAFTSFDHVGGWNHPPALAERKLQLKKLLMPAHELNISNLKTTPEGLQEYWIQWKNKKVQFDCE